MKKLLSIGLGLLLSLGLVSIAMAITIAPYWDISGTWTAIHEFSGNTYPHTNNIVQAPDGTLTGSGGWDGTQNGNPISAPNTWVITSGSSVSGNNVHFNYTYTSVETCAVDGYVDATINPDGSMTGTWHDDCNGGRTGTWTVVAGTAEALGSLAAQDFGVMNMSGVKGYTTSC